MRKNRWTYAPYRPGRAQTEVAGSRTLLCEDLRYRHVLLSLTRSGFRNFVRGDFSTFAKRYYISYPPKDRTIRRRYGYGYTKKWSNRRVKGDWRPRSQVSCWRHNPIRRLQGPPVSRLLPTVDTAMWHNEAKIASINVRRKDDKGSD